MARDSIYAGPTLWQGRPREYHPSPFMRAMGILAYGLGIVSIAFAVVRAVSLNDHAPTTFFFAVWSVTLGALIQALPAWWHGGAIYRVTPDHVIWSRGPFRRAIERRAITYARIVWSKRSSNVGSLELVRAVPNGVLRRKLLVRLEGIENPDGVWAIIRDAHEVASAGHSGLPLAQRLDRGEHILWTATPLPSLRAYLAVSSNQWSIVLLTMGLFGLGVAGTVRGVSIVERLARAGVSTTSVAFLALVLGMGLAVLCVFFVGFFVIQSTLIFRARMLRHTRYLISNKRVLIQRGREELHLDRRMIVEVIETPAGGGTYNLFLVLDGPRARALASSGAFGERTDDAAELLPVFECVLDGDGAKDALGRRSPSLPPLPWAA
jgi:hypothetical protein